MSATPKLTPRHLLNRLGCGWSTQDEALVKAAGGVAPWFEAQLSPRTVDDSPRMADVDSWFDYLEDSPTARYAASISGGRGPYLYGLGLAHWTIQRRIYTRRPVLETMVDFWSDHFNVSSGHDRAWLYRYDYDATIRDHALGRFEDLLIACSLHPAMRLFLDNWLSVADDPNENQGRELLELHTVGVGGGYTEEMVKDSATILSGYTVDWSRTFDPVYDPTRHATGPVTVLGFHHDNADQDGQAVATAYLSYLAHHPATAAFLARKLAIRFVSDTPPQSVVDKLAAAYLRADTDIAATLRALVASPEFRAAAGQKVRRPVDDLVATAKVLGVDVKAPTDDKSWANQATFAHGGDRLYSWPRPDGVPITDPPWSSAGRMFASLRMHLLETSALFPTLDVTYRTGASWLPKKTSPYATWVDQLCRQLLGKPADSRIQSVASQALQGIAGPTVSPKPPMTDTFVFRLISALLDTPDHMTR